MYCESTDTTGGATLVDGWTTALQGLTAETPRRLGRWAEQSEGWAVEERKGIFHLKWEDSCGYCLSKVTRIGLFGWIWIDNACPKIKLTNKCADQTHVVGLGVSVLWKIPWSIWYGMPQNLQNPSTVVYFIEPHQLKASGLSEIPLEWPNQVDQHGRVESSRAVFGPADGQDDQMFWDVLGCFGCFF